MKSEDRYAQILEKSRPSSSLGLSRLIGPMPVRVVSRAEEAPDEAPAARRQVLPWFLRHGFFCGCAVKGKSGVLLWGMINLEERL